MNRSGTSTHPVAVRQIPAVGPHPRQLAARPAPSPPEPSSDLIQRLALSPPALNLPAPRISPLATRTAIPVSRHAPPTPPRRRHARVRRVEPRAAVNAMPYVRVLLPA